MIIDTHAHFTPRPMLEAFAKHTARFPSVELLSGDGGGYTRGMRDRHTDGMSGVDRRR